MSATQKVSSCPEQHIYDNSRQPLNNDLLKNKDPDPTALQQHLQSVYSRACDHFLIVFLSALIADIDCTGMTHAAEALRFNRHKP